ncbi:MAG: GNAT family N-acetyltransferase [Pseudomonadales bacterium]|nr:GNAT family N-acetyltransferase [Pseudomonadales bacterium]
MARRVEEASLNAWPALHQVLLDGWVVRLTRGFTKRANSVTPLYASMQPHLAKVRYCEDLYAREGLRAIFRTTTIDEQTVLDELLSVRGYEIADPTRVLNVSLGRGAFSIAAGFEESTLSSFLATYGRLSAQPDIDAIAAGTAADLHATILRAIRSETVFGSIRENGDPVACGMAVVEHEVAGLFDVVVQPDRRRRGHGRALVESLLARASAMGARHAYLQVLADNLAARTLYESMGFAALYEYRYRLSKHMQR